MTRLAGARRAPVAWVGALVVAFVPAFSVQASGGGFPYSGDVVVDAQWILSAQRADGAIATHTDQRVISPYIANFAAVGLARATEVTGDARYAAAAWAWLAWYQAHQDVNGFVADYVAARGGSLLSTGDMDSTDAYAGTFLLAVGRTWMATGDLGRLAALRSGVEGAVRAIEATQDADGLTWAKPGWRVKYLMDQSEAYAGLRAGAEVARALGDADLQQRATADADRLARGVAGLWNPATGAYDWAVHGDGTRQPTNWSVFYPDAQQQMWAVAFGLAAGSRAKSLVSTFDAVHPTWDQPLAGYWPVTGWAFARAGKADRSLTAAANIRSAATAAARAWPFTSGNSGQLISLSDRPVGLLPLFGLRG